jgi:hypothetical protein
MGPLRLTSSDGNKMILTRTQDISTISLLGEVMVSEAKDFISIRIDQELKNELLKAAELERRSLSNFCRLLLEFAWGQYLKAGSMRELLSPQEHSVRRDE